MRVAIHQPMYLPWLGLFDRICKSDAFVILDDAQYSKNYYINRNRIKTPNGYQWLTIPVLTKGRTNQRINEVEIDTKIPWLDHHQKSIYYNYRRAPYFSKYMDFIDDIFHVDEIMEWDRLIDPVVLALQELLLELRIGTEVEFASDLNASGEKGDRILNICKEMGADEYLSGPSGGDYLNLRSWEDAGVNVIFHDYKHPVYPQLYGGFLPNMSIVDLLFNCGEGSRDILTGAYAQCNGEGGLGC